MSEIKLKYDTVIKTLILSKTRWLTYQSAQQDQMEKQPRLYEKYHEREENIKTMLGDYKKQYRKISRIQRIT